MSCVWLMLLPSPCPDARMRTAVMTKRKHACKHGQRCWLKTRKEPLRWRGTVRHPPKANSRGYLMCLSKWFSLSCLSLGCCRGGLGAPARGPGPGPGFRGKTRVLRCPPDSSLPSCAPQLRSRVAPTVCVLATTLCVSCMLLPQPRPVFTCSSLAVSPRTSLRLL